MKIKKLFLFWLFSLFWIFNFSSAENYEWMSFSCYLWDNAIEWYNQCNDDYLNFLSIEDWNYIVSASSNFNFEAYLTFMNAKEWQPFHISPSNSISFSCEDWDCFSLNIYNYSNVDWEWLITYTVSPASNWWSSDTIIPWWFNNFVPVVNWLGSTVTQFIPFVVYISVWFLIAVLWFYAIKWLCNWFLIKLNSVFKSKRW